ncbi:MAG: hypothetical protein WBP18_19210, partial [Paracoccaceae bacterium]
GMNRLLQIVSCGTFASLGKPGSRPPGDLLRTIPCWSGNSCNRLSPKPNSCVLLTLEITSTGTKSA